MIAWLKGILIKKQPNLVVLDVGGVGYQIRLSLSSFCLLPELDTAVALDIFTYVREDQITLYGFLVPREKQTFQLLIGVNGIGPKLAQNVLSGIHPDELANAISAGNVKRLQATPGVGKKMAERMVIELKDKLQGVAAPEQARLAIPGAIAEDLSLALATLGYKKVEIDKVIRTLPIQPGDGLEDAIRKALKLLRPRGL